MFCALADPRGALGPSCGLRHRQLLPILRIQLLIANPIGRHEDQLEVRMLTERMAPIQGVVGRPLVEADQTLPQGDESSKSSAMGWQLAVARRVGTAVTDAIVCTR